jgi:predicted GH43/DUF377 family glycosyl hydrolase
MFQRTRTLLLLVLAGSLFAVLGSSNTERAALAQTATETAAQVTFNFRMVDSNPILKPGAVGQWDAVSVRFPQVIVYKGTYYLFYATFQNMNDPVGIGFAQSDDGIHWTKFNNNPILKGSSSGFDAFGVTRPVVMVEQDGTWVLFYNGIPAPNMVFGPGIGRATAPAPDGPWTRGTNPILEAGSSGQWDRPFLFPDSVVKDGDQYVLYYSSGFMVGRATSSDGKRWTKYDNPSTAGPFAMSDPILKLGTAGSWDSVLAWGSSVQHTKSGWEMFYYGGSKPSGGAHIKIGYAYSTDGINWTKHSDPIIGFEDRQAFFPSFVINEDSTYNVYYAVTFGQAATDIYLSTGTIRRSKD